MNEDMFEAFINQTLDAVLATVPVQLQEVEQNGVEWKVENPKEFVYGFVVGTALSMGGALLSAQSEGMPTPEEQMKVRDAVYDRIPDIRERIFG